MSTSSADYFTGNSHVKELRPADFDPNATWILKDKRCGVVMFYAPWCPHCKNMKSIWEQLAMESGFMNVYALNCERHKGHLAKIKEDMPNLVRTFPTIIFYKKGEPVEAFVGDRTKANIMKSMMRVCSSE